MEEAGSTDDLVVKVPQHLQAASLRLAAAGHFGSDGGLLLLGQKRGRKREDYIVFYLDVPFIDREQLRNVLPELSNIRLA
jgi:hypothetical protein